MDPAPCYGAYAALTDGVSRAWIANLVPATQRTWALGIHGGVTGISVLLAGLWSGVAWNHTGRVPLTISGVVALAIATWLFTMTTTRAPSVARARQKLRRSNE